MSAITTPLIMLDLDGTLVDSAPDLAVAVDKMLVSLDRSPAGEDRVRTWIGNGASMLVARALSGAMEPETNHRSGELFDAAYLSFLTQYAESNGKFAQLYPGVEKALDNWFAQKIPLAVITNKPKAFTVPLLKAFRLSRYFHFVMGGDSLPEKKPHPAQLNEVIQQLGAVADRCWMVGDSRNDVQAARAAGCKAACVNYGYNHGEAIELSEPDLIISRLDQLEFVAPPLDD